MISYGIFFLLIIVIYNVVLIKLVIVLMIYFLGDEINVVNILIIM